MIPVRILMAAVPILTVILAKDMLASGRASFACGLCVLAGVELLWIGLIDITSSKFKESS